MTVPLDETGSETPGETTEESTEEKLFDQAEVDKMITTRLAREKAKYEREAEARVEKARLASLSDSEKVIETAKAEARAEVRLESAKELVSAKIVAALTGIVDDPDEIIDDLDLSKFLDADSNVDTDAIKALKAKYAKLSGTKKPTAPNLGHGRQATSHSSSPQDDFTKAMGDLMA